MSRSHTDLEKQHRPPPPHSQNQACTCHHVHFHHHPHPPLHRFGKMSEEILFDRSMIDKFGQGGHGRGFVGNGNEKFGNDRHNRLGNDGGGNGLNPRARSFFTTYPLADSLPTIPSPPDRQAIFQPPQPRPRVRIEAPPGPIPTQVHSEPPRTNNHPNWMRYDAPPHQGRGSKSNAIIIHPPPPGEHNHYTPQLTRGPPRPRFQEIPSTTFHIGPIPPNFTIDQLHQAMRALNPKVAMLDLKMGVMEVEIPFTLTWAQIGDWCRRGLKIGDLTIPVKPGVSTTPERPFS